MKQKTITINDQKITIKELTPRDIKNVFSNLIEVFSDENLDVKTLIIDKYDTVIDIAKNFVNVENGEIDELGFSDLEQIIPAFKEVNESFLVMMGRFDLDKVLPQEQAKSTQ